MKKIDKNFLINFEKDIKNFYEKGKIKSPIHLSGNNENQLLNIFKKIKKNDWVLCSWRNHYHALLKGINPNELKNEWRQMTLQDMVILLKTLQNRMIKELTKWKLENQQLFQDDAKLSTTFSKSVIKLMGITYTQDATMSKIKNSLFNYLKVDFKNMIEYEFEF